MRNHQLLSRMVEKRNAYRVLVGNPEINRQFRTCHLENISFAVSEQFKLFVTFID
jgi:hypothetical protein